MCELLLLGGISVSNFKEEPEKDPYKLKATEFPPRRPPARATATLKLAKETGSHSPRSQCQECDCNVFTTGDYQKGLLRHAHVCK